MKAKIVTFFKNRRERVRAFCRKIDEVMREADRRETEIYNAQRGIPHEVDRYNVSAAG